MSLINRPFVKLANHENTETGFIISFKKFPEIEEEFYSTLNKWLTKLSSSKKTKALSYLIEKKCLYLGYSLTNVIHNGVPVYGINYVDGNALRSITVDLAKVLSPSYHTEFVSNLNIISQQVEVIKANESMLTSTGTDQIKMAKESIVSKYQDMLANIDWFQLLDIYYFQYIKFLTKKTLMDNKGKVFVLVSNILKSTLKKMIAGYSSKQELTFKENKMLTMLLDYLIISHYSNNPPQETLNTIIKATIHDAKERNLEEIDEIIEKIKEIKPTRYKNLEDITYMLAEAKIMNITPNAFIKLLGESFGPKFHEFNSTIESMVAYFISTTYQSEIFSIKNIHNSNFKEDISQLEELVLNAKGNTLIKPF